LKVCDTCISEDKDCPSCKTAEKKEMAEENGDKTAQSDLEEAVGVIETEAGDTATGKGIAAIKDTTVSQISNARIKAAYSCATKLALAGIINSDECDSYADQLLEDGLRADVMIKNTQLLLRSAQASAERVAASAAQRLNTRTASAMSISTSPALSGSSSSAALDIQSALKGTWTMPKINED
jgi:hypothetical protein